MFVTYVITRVALYIATLYAPAYILTVSSSVEFMLASSRRREGHTFRWRGSPPGPRSSRMLHVLCYQPAVGYQELAEAHFQVCGPQPGPVRMHLSTDMEATLPVAGRAGGPRDR
jgi:hypothetical protein